MPKEILGKDDFKFLQLGTYFSAIVSISPLDERSVLFVVDINVFFQKTMFLYFYANVTVNYWNFSIHYIDE